MKRKSFMALLPAIIVLLVLLLSIAGCKKKEEAAAPEAPKVITIFGAFVDEEARRFEAAIQPFVDRTGIQVKYEGSSEFETLISVRVEGGNPPDIAALPQPGLMKNFAAQGKLVPLWPELVTQIGKNYVARETRARKGMRKPKDDDQPQVCT